MTAGGLWKQMQIWLLNWVSYVDTCRLQPATTCDCSQAVACLCRHGQKTTIYKYYATFDGLPLRLHMHGNDISSGAHFGTHHPQPSKRPCHDAMIVLGTHVNHTPCNWTQLPFSLTTKRVTLLFSSRLKVMILLQRNSARTRDYAWTVVT